MRSIGFMTRHSDDSASLLFEKREARKWRGTGNRAVARATIMATIGKGGDTMNEIRISRRAARNTDLVHGVASLADCCHDSSACDSAVTSPAPLAGFALFEQ